MIQRSFDLICGPIATRALQEAVAGAAPPAGDHIGGATDEALIHAAIVGPERYGAIPQTTLRLYSLSRFPASGAGPEETWSGLPVGPAPTSPSTVGCLLRGTTISVPWKRKGVGLVGAGKQISRSPKTTTAGYLDGHE